MSGRPQTPSQTVGPFFGVGLSREPMNVMRDHDRGEIVRIEGTVFDGAGAPIDDAMIEIWQAGVDRRDAHSLAHDGPFAGNNAGFGRAETSPDGTYFFETTKPGPIRTMDGRWQAPHLNVIVFARGMLVHAFTRMYFSDDARTADDPLLASIDPARRHTLIGDRRDRTGTPVYSWDIHLQGEGETVFLDA